MGVFIGDAFALPVECRSPDFIKEHFGYLDSFQNNSTHRYPGVAKQPKGTKSDDSQLQKCMMDSLGRKGGYNINDIKLAHIEAQEGKWGEPIGWGRTTRQSIEKMKEGCVYTYIKDGAGNGPVIKIAPLAIYSTLKTATTSIGKFTNSFNHSLFNKCKEISLLTHEDLGCAVAAYCHARCIIRALQDELPKTTSEIVAHFVNDAEFAENKLGGFSAMSDRLKQILQWNRDGLSVFDIETSKVSTTICTEKSSWIYNSYPLTAYCIAKYAPLRNFRHAIYETANAGADADSNTSMVGSIMGALLGLHEIPVDLIRSVVGWRDDLRQARQFVLSIV